MSNDEQMVGAEARNHVMICRRRGEGAAALASPRPISMLAEVTHRCTRSAVPIAPTRWFSMAVTAELDTETWTCACLTRRRRSASCMFICQGVSPARGATSMQMLHGGGAYGSGLYTKILITSAVGIERGSARRACRRRPRPRADVRFRTANRTLLTTSPTIRGARLPRKKDLAAAVVRLKNSISTTVEHVVVHPRQCRAHGSPWIDLAIALGASRS